MSAIAEDIYINDYLYFDAEYGYFNLSDKAKEILYRQKEVICSYSGCNEWGHNFFCELIDLYSGSSQYNYALGTVVHAYQIKEMYRNGHKDEVINWVNKHKNDMCFSMAAAMLANIINDVPKQ